MTFLVGSRNFQKQVEKLSVKDQEKVLQTLKTFRAAIAQGDTSKGLGFKKLDHDKYEIRVDLRTRIGMTKSSDTFILHFIGNHEDIQNFLKNY